MYSKVHVNNVIRYNLKQQITFTHSFSNSIAINIKINKIKPAKFKIVQLIKILQINQIPLSKIVMLFKIKLLSSKIKQPK